MGTGGRSRLGEGEGHFILGGWRKEAGIMDMDIAVACGGGSGDGKILRLMVLTGAVE